MKRSLDSLSFSKNVRSAVATAILGLAAALPATNAMADVVTDWSAHATEVLTGALTSTDERPGFGLHWALVHVAIYDAVNAIDGNYSVFAVRPDSFTRGASMDAAAASAAYRMLSRMFPSRQASLDAWYASSLAAIADGPGKSRGIAIGREVADKLYAKRASDGRLATVTYTFGSGPGVYQATPGAPPTAPITPWLAKVTPLVMSTPWQFRGDGPPALGSAHYAADLNETKQMGMKNSPYRSAEQTEIGKFHTMNPFLFWGTNLNRFVNDLGLTVPENARLLAQVYVSAADAAIACWDGKFYFNRWRPVTAIVNADLDGNLATASQYDWLPQEGTPPHQEYPAGHGCATGSILAAMRHYFGTQNLPLTLTSTTTATTRTYESFKELSDEVNDARVFGGMHLRLSVEDGQKIGRKAAGLVAAKHFKQVWRGGDRY